MKPTVDNTTQKTFSWQYEFLFRTPGIYYDSKKIAANLNSRFLLTPRLQHTTTQIHTLTHMLLSRN